MSCENNNSSLFSAVPDSSNMYQNKDSNLIRDQIFTYPLNLLYFLKTVSKLTPFMHIIVHM